MILPLPSPIGFRPNCLCRCGKQNSENYRVFPDRFIANLSGISFNRTLLAYFTSLQLQAIIVHVVHMNPTTLSWHWLGVEDMPCKRLEDDKILVASPFTGDGRLTAVGGKPRRYLHHFVTVLTIRQSLFAIRRRFRLSKASPSQIFARRSIISNPLWQGNSRIKK